MSRSARVGCGATRESSGYPGDFGAISAPFGGVGLSAGRRVPYESVDAVTRLAIIARRQVGAGPCRSGGKYAPRAYAWRITALIAARLARGTLRSRQLSVQ